MIDLAWVIGNVVGAILILATLLYLVWANITDDLDGERGIWVVGGIVALIIQIGVNVFWNFPFDMAYHSYRPVSGVVEDINSRFLSSNSGKSTEQKYAVRFKGSDQIYGCMDTRCSLAKKGDHLQLACERQWQYASVSGYDCRYFQ